MIFSQESDKNIGGDEASDSSEGLPDLSPDMDVNALDHAPSDEGSVPSPLSDPREQLGWQSYQGKLIVDRFQN
jgi:hypothetical protein